MVISVIIIIDNGAISKQCFFYWEEHIILTIICYNKWNVHVLAQMDFLILLVSFRISIFFVLLLVFAFFRDGDAAVT